MGETEADSPLKTEMKGEIMTLPDKSNSIKAEISYGN